jgi:hypothetical protein
MVPAHFVQLHLPLTLTQARLERLSVSFRAASPAAPTTKRVRSIELASRRGTACYGQNGIALEDNFFALGASAQGHHW